MADIIESPIGDIGVSSIAAGDFTPGAAYAIDVNVKIINAIWELAFNKTSSFDSRITDLINWLAANVVDAIEATSVSAGTVSAGEISATDATAGTVAATSISAGTVTAGSITATAPTEPSMTIGDVSPALVLGSFSTQAGTIIADLAGKFSAFVATWFPDEPETYAAAEGWLVSAISNTTSGAIPAAIKANILADGTAQIYADQTRAIAEVYEAAVSRRQQFPPGATDSAALRVARGAQDAVAALTRTIAIRDFDLSYQKALEAVRMALSNRQAALSSAINYIQAMVAGYGQGWQVTGGAYDAQTRMINAAYQAFSARTNAQELMLRATQADKTLALDAAKVNLSTAFDAAKLNQATTFDAEKSSKMLAFEASKANQAAALEADKASKLLTFDADKTTQAWLMDAQKLNQAGFLEAAKTNQAAALQNVENNVKVFSSQAQMLAHQVVSMLNNLRAGGSSSYTVSA